MSDVSSLNCSVTVTTVEWADITAKIVEKFPDLPRIISSEIRKLIKCIFVLIMNEFYNYIIFSIMDLTQEYIKYTFDILQLLICVF